MPDGEGPRRARREALACFALLVAVFLVFGRLHGAAFLSFDDPQYVLNGHVPRGLDWENLRWAFLEAHAHNWHPVTWLSHMADVALFGLDPGRHHLVSVAFHALNALLLFRLLEELTDAFWPSLATAALFAFHPLHVESVAWIAERKDVLSGCFALLTLLAYARWVRSGSRKAWAAALVLFALGLMAKPMLVTLPVLMLCLDHWPLGRTGRPWARLALEKWPFFLMSLLCAGVTLVTQRGSIETTAEAPFGAHVLNALAAYGRYLGKTVWPADLAAYYPQLPPGRLLALGLVSLGVLAALTWAVVRFGRSRPWLPMAWVWFLAGLLPVIGLVQVGGQSMADRYTYLPLVGPFAAAAWLGAEAVARWRPSRWLVAALAAALFGGLMARSWVEAGYWKDDRTLFTRDLAVVGENRTARLCLGLGALRDGDRQEAARELAAAAADDPGLGLARFWLGEALLGLGREAEARDAYLADLDLEPDNYQAMLRVAPILMKEGRLGEAVPWLQRYILLEPLRLGKEPDPGAQRVGTREARMRLGLILRQLARPEEACAVFRDLAQAAPGEPGPLLNLGLALKEAGRREEALAVLRRCAALAPDSVPVRQALAQAGGQAR